MKLLFFSVATSSHVPEAQQKIFLEKKWLKCNYAGNFTKKWSLLEMKSETMAQIPARISQETQIHANNHD